VFAYTSSVQRRLTVAGPVLLMLAMATLARSDQGQPTLHEYVDPRGGSKGSGSDRLLGDKAAAGHNPPGFRMGGRVLPAPATKQPPGSNEPVLGQSGFAVDRDTTLTPDRNTGADSTLHYVEIFNPSIVPFKRMSALDGVRDDYTMVVSDPALESVDVGGAPLPERDLFWGSSMIEFTPGKNIALPSVAPEARILSYELDPPGTVEFFRDGADNFFVRSDTIGQHRLVWLTDAPASYFGGPLPAGLRFGDVPPGKVRPVPAKVARAAEDVFAIIGVTRNEPYDVALSKLVRYFREFQAGAIPSPTGDVYLDLAKAQVGVCRHRSFAFQVTANALGIPARYVSNEAHAWAEVFVPHVGWVRVDLGGAALQLDVQGAAGKSMHRPREADGFPKPPAYSDQYTQLKGDIQGLTQDQIADVQSGPLSGVPTPTPGPMSTPDGGIGQTPLTPGPVSQVPSPPPLQSGVKPTQIMVEPIDKSGFRGEPVRAAGRIITTADGLGVPGLRVELYIRPKSLGGGYFLGSTVTLADGSFEISADLPREAPLGEHEVLAFTPGDSKFGSSSTQ